MHFLRLHVMTFGIFCSSKSMAYGLWNIHCVTSPAV